MNEETKKIPTQEAREAFNKFKYEAANEVVPNGYGYGYGYGGGLSSNQNTYVGGYMVRKMIEAQEKQMAAQGK